VYNPISPDHWTDHWQIEGNTMTNSGVGIELNDTTDSLVFNNTIDGASTKGMDLWQYFTSCSMNGNSILYNHISNVTGSYAIDVHVDPGSLQYIGNTITNANIGIYLNSNMGWVFGDNTYTNVSTWEYYSGYGYQALSPATLEIVSSTSTSVTVRVVTQSPISGTQFWFEAKEYIAQDNVTTFNAGSWKSSDTYTFTGLSSSHKYSFRVRALVGSVITPWSIWVFP
jgi:parallel beta-helix repeat protein